MILDTNDADLAIAKLMKQGGTPVRAFLFSVQYQVTLDLPPSANRYWRRVGHTLYRSREAAQYIERVHFTLMSAGFVDPIKNDFILVADVYIARGDLGNREKVLSDALQGALYLDDKQIVQIHLVRHQARVKDQRVVLSLVG